MSPANYDILTILSVLGGLLHGHFVLKSGRHSDQYLNKDVIYPDTDVMEAVGKHLVDLAVEKGVSDVQLVAGPEKGGIILAQWTAHAMYRTGKPRTRPKAIYAEKSEDVEILPDGKARTFVFKRDYATMIPGSRVLLVEDIVTTGGSVAAAAEEVTRLGGCVTGIVALVNRGNVTMDRLHTLASIDIKSWSPQECPLCQQGVPINTNVGHGGKK